MPGDKTNNELCSGRLRLARRVVFRECGLPAPLGRPRSLYPSLIALGERLRLLSCAIDLSTLSASGALIESKNLSEVVRVAPVATENRIRAGAAAAMGYPHFGMIDLLKRHCQVASSGRVMGKTSSAGVRLQAQLRQHRTTCRRRHCEPCDTGWH